jgi:nanoRNase/pAp phosphatase (c-di-AMP/oligoRNAs hydrolase)
MADCSEVYAVLERHESVLIVTHTHADLDTLGSAIGLAQAFPGAARIVIPDGVQRRAKRLPQTLDIDLTTPEEVNIATTDCVVVVDAPSTDRVAPITIDDRVGEVVVIDHHEPDDLANRATATAIDTDAGATATLVTQLITNSDWVLEPDAGLALAAGLLDDTELLTTATPAEFALLGDLLDAAREQVNALPQILARESSFSERVAATKAVVRATGYRAGRTLVLTTRVGGQQTAAAHTLREAGADIALVISDRSSQTWVVGRAEADQVHLPENVFTPLIEEYGGDGGGHAGAGVAKLDTGTPDEIRTTALDCIEAALGEPLSDLS